MKPTIIAWIACAIILIAFEFTVVLAERPPAPLRLTPLADGHVSLVAVCSPTTAIRFYRGPWPEWLAWPDFYSNCPEDWVLHQSLCVEPAKSADIQEQCAP